ncbi:MULTISPECIES: flagellar basal-body MS-ring/collar protein FliF [Undibacterium]|uniref:Flagellar M-ring protein n=1 Tax=Undibacterium umbellatum TaxID=2762300 RepID=A0ABR6ZC35_9BURK|nr:MULTISPECIES: flagellar basal-body MS-ring/collar protein FliF [Undibacterium]MBC3909144.1 flagellar M-ring protein FliF [Undibacterium umbellatum]MDP1979281.1 flagellar basal-body MS-ring/collar protein FliF [Undibacterium sp.]
MATAENIAIAPPGPALPGLFGLPQTPVTRNIMLSVGAAITIAIMVGVWLWSQTPDYKVLFSNFNDRDGGAIVASLQQLNIPYKYSDGGSAILVPANQVHDVRLKLAAQGLPKGGNVGFELMENQKLGISQFLEQVNFQRALEGELARSIQAVSAVQTARVHLAIPKSQVFIRDQQKPTASVLLNLYPSRILDQQQVSAIIHLVASSVPELSAKNVAIIDQNGNLLSDPSKQMANNTLDPSQLKYVQEYQQSIIKRIESIISPIVGAANVRAEATADIDFSRTEQAAESYKPNSPPEASAIRSQQTSESYNKGTNPSGIPGALSNQPPVPATAPIVASGAANTQSAASNAGLMQKDSTMNFEVDKTIRYTQQPMGGVKRLSVAVVINYRTETDKNGKTTTRPLTDIEKTQITDLTREAMGFNKDRGDTLNVVNSPFASPEKEPIVDLPLWKQPDVLQMAKEVAKYIGVAIVLAYLFFGFLKPMLLKIMGKDKETLEALEAEKREQEEVEKEEEDAAIVNLSREAELQNTRHGSSYETNLEMAKQLAKDDPRIVANVVKAWVSNE